MSVIKIATDFSEEPAGRFYADGPFSGERFREELLVPALGSEKSVEVDIDDLEGYGSSFLEESFGGLVRKGYFSSEVLHQRLVISSLDKAVIEEIWGYIDDAVFGVDK